jgi:hypothetical protein
VDVNLDLYAVAPALIWEPDVKVLGERYAALVAPSFANASVEAGLSVGTTSIPASCPCWAPR